MALTVSTIAASKRLTRRAAVEDELGLSATTILDPLINEASAAIASWCRRQFAREIYSETLPGYGDLHLQVARTPIITVASVLHETDAVTDYSIADRDEGTLYRQVGWVWTRQINAGLTGRQRWPAVGYPVPGSEEPDFTVAYTAGYILPDQWIVDETTISAAASDDSFSDSASGFPATLKAGEVIEVSGFSGAANNGRFLVTGTPTAAKISITGSLALEAAGPSVTVKFRNHPEAREIDDLEKACIETVKAWYLERTATPGLIERQVGPMRERKSEADVMRNMALPATAIGLLRPWARAA